MYAIGGYFMYVIFAAAVFLTCSKQHFVDVFQQTRSRSIPPRPNTLSLLFTLPCQSLREFHDRNHISPFFKIKICDMGISLLSRKTNLDH